MDIDKFLSRLKRAIRLTQHRNIVIDQFSFLAKQISMALFAFYVTTQFLLWAGPPHWFDEAQLERGLPDLVKDVPIRVYRGFYAPYYSYSWHSPEYTFWYTTEVRRERSVPVAVLWSWHPLLGWSQINKRAAYPFEEDLWQHIFSQPVYLTNPRQAPTR